MDRIAQLYHLNGLRMKTCVDSPQRMGAQSELEKALQQMAAQCAAGVANHKLFPPAAKVLESMTFDWSGLTVFVDSPWVAMDNNTAERDIRGPVVGRKNFYGSGSEASAELAATMYSALATLKLWGLNARTWLGAYLQACADNGNQPPENINAFLPWQMETKRLADMRACRLQEEFNSS